MNTHTHPVLKSDIYQLSYGKVAALFVVTSVITFGFASFTLASSSSRDYNYDRDHSYYYDYNDYDHGHYGYNDGYRDDNGRWYKPSCSITIKDYNGGVHGYDRSITLAWSSSYATSAYITDIGSVGTNGMQAVMYPYESSYRMTVRGPGGSATCETGHAYNAAYFDDTYYRHDQFVTRPYIQPIVQPFTVAQPYVMPYVQPSYLPTYAQNYVPLSQIPYTGFDFGLVGNAIYWLTIILAAMGGAYLIVYSHSGHYPREFAREVVVAARNQAKVVRSLIQ